MAYIGKTPTSAPLTASDITNDIINADKIADNSISEEHLDATVVTGLSALGAEPADTDEFLISDAGTLKRMDYSYIKSSGGTHIQLASVESTSNDGTISIQDKFTVTYDFYRFFLQWKQTTDGSDTRFRWLKGGSTEESGSHYIYTSDRHEINSTPSSYAGTDHQGYNQSYALVANHLPANSEAHFHTLDWTIYNPYKGSPSGRAKVMGMKTYVRTDSTWRGGTISIEYDSGDSSNQYGGFKLFPSTGYMTDYKYQLYGVKFS